MSINTLIAEEVIGQLPEGDDIKAFTLRNEAGGEARFVNLGAAFIGFSLPGQANNEPLNLVLGCDTLDALIHQRASLGATVGRYANRIGQGRAMVDGQVLELDVNTPPHHLHGGNQGFGSRIWDSHITVEDGVPTLTFKLFSADGEGGYPGNLEVIQRVRLLQDHSINIEYHAETDKPTLVNLTNHAYFNLAGATAGELKNHEFKVHSDRYTEVDETALPTGRILPVEGTVMDLREWTDLTPRLATLDDPTLLRADGYDHNYIFGEQCHHALKLQAEVRNRVTGYWLTCASTLPGVQLYTGNFLGGTPKNDEERYRRHGAFCLEPGYWPDSPNHEHFPDCVVKPEQPYQARIVYRFGYQDPGSMT